MADFSQSPNQQQDPDAIKKALLAKLFGGTPGAGLPTSPGAPGTAQPTPDATAAAPPTTAQPTTPTSAPAQPITPAAGPTPAKPMTAAPAAVEPGSPSPILSEADYGKQNPAAPHTPYVEPDLKHRLLEGIFAGAQAFGKDPGAGERMLNSYLGNIQKNEDAEANYGQTSAADAHKKYMDYVAGAKAPIDLEDLQSQIGERQAHAKELAASAAAKANPVGKVQHLVVDDPANPGEPKAAYFDEAKKAYIDPDTQQPIPGAKPFEKAPAEHNLEKITVNGPDGKPHVYGVNAKGEKVQDFGVAPQQQKESRSDKSADVVERETRTNIRKAQQSYRGAESTANMQREFISEAKGGNKAAVKIVPLEGALEITTSQGVHRINRTEVEQYGGAGSLWDRIVGKIGKGLTGKDIPDDVLNDMDKMTQEVEKNAWERYNSEYDDEVGIAKNNGVANIEQHLPRIKQRAGGAAAAAPAAGGAGALPPGWK